MVKKQDKNQLRKVRHLRVRKKIAGTADRPRLCVYRSLNNIYVQIIDDKKGHTVVSASTKDKEIAAAAGELNKAGAARLVGKIAAERAKAAGIEHVVFDRGGYIYTGRVAEIAAGAREAGLDF